MPEEDLLQEFMDNDISRESDRSRRSESDRSELRDNEFKCTVCAKVFNLERSLKRHMISHYGTHRCIFCKKIYMEFHNLTAHIHAKHGEENLKLQAKKLSDRELRIRLERVKIPKCNGCDKIFWNSDCLVKHKLICDKNRKGGDEDLEAQRALQVDPQEKQFKCHLCELSTYTTLKSLKWHLKWKHNTDYDQKGTEKHNKELQTATNYSNFKCQYCNAILTTSKGLKYHQTLKHPQQTLSQTESDSDYEIASTHNENSESDKHFKCQYCSSSFSLMKGLNYHMTMKHKNEKVKLEESDIEVETEGVTSTIIRCQHCPMTFMASRGFKNHMHFKHPQEKIEFTVETVSEEKEPESEEKSFTCKYCDATFTAKKNLKGHVTRKHPDEKARYGDSDTETEVIPKQTEISCPECNEKFASLRAFRYHQIEKHNEVMSITKAHSPIKVPSPVKEKTPPPPKTNSEEPYTVVDAINDLVRCNVCEKVLGRKAFKTHYVLHSDPKHRCEFCPKEFARRDYLSCHLNNSHPKELVCAFCNIQSRNKILYEAHLKTHEPVSSQGSTTQNLNSNLPGKKLRSSGASDLEPPLANPESILSKPPSQIFPCKVCAREFTAYAYLDKHLRARHPESSIIEFIAPDEMEYYSDNDNDNDISIESGSETNADGSKQQKVSKAIVCEVCKRKYYNLEKYWCHMKFKHNRIPIEEVEAQAKAQKEKESAQSAPKMPTSDKISNNSNQPKTNFNSSSTPTTSNQYSATTSTTMKPTIEEDFEIPTTMTYACDICPVVKKRRDYLKVHVKAEHGEYYCNKCEIQSSNFNCFLEHSMTEHKDCPVHKTEHQCKKCFIMFKSAAVLQVHQMYKHSKNRKMFQGQSCYICNIRFPELINLETHFGSPRHKTISRFVEEFEESQKDSNAIETPEKSKTADTADNRKYFVSSCQIQQCKMCSPPKKFSLRNGLFRHLRHSHKELLKFKCSIQTCQKGFILESTLQRHMNLIHSQKGSPKKESEEPPQKPFIGHSYRKHIIKTKLGQYRCRSCKKIYETTKALFKHLLTHSSVDRVACEDCGDEFLNEEFLARHEKMKHKRGLKKTVEEKQPTVEEKKSQKPSPAKVVTKSPEKVDDEDGILICKICEKECVSRKGNLN